ncbi:MAG: hypothetical protein HFE63_08460 [Clostridiales bacterium]|nr:hypothetical protein [Clostridiales bacterium]
MKQNSNALQSDEAKRLSKKMGIGSLIAAAIFLFNPCLNILDILPDFFGYIFLINGLTKWADICPGMADAIQGLNKLKWFMLLKLFMMVLMPLVDDTFVLVFTFGFAIIELIYLIPAIGRIFAGFEYFGTRFDGFWIYVNYKNVRTITYLFFWARSILIVIPELCSLSSFEYSGYVTSGVQINFANYKGALIIVGTIITLLTGIMWLVNIIPYFKHIGNDVNFLKRVEGQYDLEISNNVGLTLRRDIHKILTLIIAGGIFFLNIWVEQINVIPNFIGGIFLIVAIVKLSKYLKTTKPALYVSIAFTAVSVISYTVSLLFSIFFGLASIELDFAAYDIYNITRVLSIIEYAIMLAAVYLIICELRKMIKMYLSADPDVSDKRLLDIYAGQQRELDRRYVVCLVIFVISFILNIAYAIMRAEIVNYFPQFWLIMLIVTGIWWVLLKSTNDQMFDQIEYKYM